MHISLCFNYLQGLYIFVEDNVENKQKGIVCDIIPNVLNGKHISCLGFLKAAEKITYIKLIDKNCFG